MAPGQGQRIEAKEVALTSAGSWIMTIVYAVFTSALFLFVAFKVREFVPILICGFFAAWGVVGIVMLLRAESSQKRYGAMPLLLDGPAPALGGSLRASLFLPSTVTRMPMSLRAVLTCSKVTYDVKGARLEEPLQGLRKAVAVARSPTGARVGFDFAIPADLPYTEDPGRTDAIPNAVYGRWELKVDTVGGLANFSRSYDIPVGRALPGMATPPPARPASLASLPPGEGPIEIVRPGARAAEPPVALRAAVPPVPPRVVAPPVVASVVADAIPEPAPGLAPEEDNQSLWVLVAVNLIPLAGVMFAGWRVHEVVFLYWIENLVIGAVNVLRMRIAVPDTLPDMAQRGVAPEAGDLFVAKAVLIGFFIVHYGAFCFGHGTFLALLFPPQEGGSRELGAVLRSMLLNPATLVAITGIVVSHAYSYFHNYLGRGEYLHQDLRKLMFRPYKRIVVTHLFIFAGAFALQKLGSPVAAMLAFIGLKISIDAFAHVMERKQLRPSG